MDPFMNKIYNEDCRKTLKKNLDYNYVFCVPPDYNELEMCPAKNALEYYNFLYWIFEELRPKNNVVTIGITDRKFRGGILIKHREIIRGMESLDYKYISQKIWCKSYKQNLYRLNYSFIMTFAKGKIKQNHNPRFEEDVWNAKVYKHKGYNYAVALEVVKRCIANFTKPGEIVYDPFMGSGTTAIACLETDRKYIGSEIKKEYFDIASDRLNKYRENNENLFI